MKSSYGCAVKKPVRYNNDSNMLVKCSNQNCIEENNVSYFRISTRCSSYFCYQCCDFSQKILKLLNDGNDNHWFCPGCAKAALNAIFMEKDIEGKRQSYFSLLEPRIVDLKELIFKKSINLKSQINKKVDNSVFDDMVNESKKKLETFESNLSCLRSEIDNLQLKDPNPMTVNDVINNDSPGYDPEISNLSIPSQISKCAYDCFERANNVIVFNLRNMSIKLKMIN